MKAVAACVYRGGMSAAMPGPVPSFTQLPLVSQGASPLGLTPASPADSVCSEDSWEDVHADEASEDES